MVCVDERVKMVRKLESSTIGNSGRVCARYQLSSIPNFQIPHHKLHHYSLIEFNYEDSVAQFLNYLCNLFAQHQLAELFHRLFPEVYHLLNPK
jgi:hypothetical protein